MCWMAPKPNRLGKQVSYIVANGWCLFMLVYNYVDIKGSDCNEEKKERMQWPRVVWLLFAKIIFAFSNEKKKCEQWNTKISFYSKFKKAQHTLSYWLLLFFYCIWVISNNNCSFHLMIRSALHYLYSILIGQQNIGKCISFRFVNCILTTTTKKMIG